MTLSGERNKVCGATLKSLQLAQVVGHSNVGVCKPEGIAEDVSAGSQSHADHLSFDLNTRRTIGQYDAHTPALFFNRPVTIPREGTFLPARDSSRPLRNLPCFLSQPGEADQKSGRTAFLDVGCVSYLFSSSPDANVTPILPSQPEGCGKGSREARA